MATNWMTTLWIIVLGFFFVPVLLALLSGLRKEEAEDAAEAPPGNRPGLTTRRRGRLE